MCCLVGNSSGILIGVATGGSRYWEPTLRNGNRLGPTEEDPKREESRLLHQDLLSSLGMGSESEKR